MQSSGPRGRTGKPEYNTLLVLLRAGFGVRSIYQDWLWRIAWRKGSTSVEGGFFHRDLYSLVFGESVLNDAVAIVLYQARNTRLMTPAACFCHAVV